LIPFLHPNVYPILKLKKLKKKILHISVKNDKFSALFYFHPQFNLFPLFYFSSPHFPRFHQFYM